MRALTLLPKQSIAYTNATTGAYNAATGSVNTTQINYNVEAVVSEYGARDVDGSRIQANDREFIFQASEFDVKEGGLIGYGGDNYSAVSFEHVPAAAVWIVQGRR